MASVKQITNVIGAIKTIYTYYAKEADVQTLVSTWHLLLKDYPDEIVDKALMLCLQSCKMPPTPADIIEQIKHMQEAEGPSDEEYWDQYQRALRKGNALTYRFNATYVEENGKTQGANARAEFMKLWESLPERLQMYIGSHGEFVRMARDYGDEDLKFEKNRFMKNMPVMRSRQEYRQIMPGISGTDAGTKRLTDAK